MRKTRKLALQVSAIVSVMVMLTMAVIGFIVINGTRNMYIQLNMDKISKEITQYTGLFMSPELAGTVLDEWQKDPEMMSEPKTELQSIYEDTLEYYSHGVVEMPDINERTEEDRRAFLKAMYNHIVSYFDEKRGSGSFDSVFCFDIRSNDDLCEEEKDDLYIIFECSSSTDGTGSHKLGTYYRMKDSYEALEKIRNGTYGVDYGDIVYQELDVMGNNSLSLLAFVPVFINDEQRYVMCFKYNWSSFARTLDDNLRFMILLGIIVLLLTNGLLILFIYRRAVRPTVRINESVREYMETKDSAAVIKKMSEIKAENEVGGLADSISELAAEIERNTQENLRLAGERQRVETELEFAAKIQNGILPEEFPDRPEFELSATMVPAKEVGGDFYDFFFIGEKRLGLVIADVSGKGIPAALFMMMSKMLIKNYAMEGLSPAEVLTRTNLSILENNRNKMFVTVWFGVMDISAGHVTAANGGHEYPMIRKPGGEFEIVKDKHSFVLGVRNKKYTEYEFDIEPGGTLFVYTDGAPEAMGAGNEMFGTQRMLSVLNKEPDAMPEKLIENMNSAVSAFVGSIPHSDDITMLCVRYSGKTPEEQDN